MSQASTTIRAEPKPLTYQPAPPISRRIDWTAVIQSAALYLVLIGLAVLCLVPFLWLICASFKRQEDLFGYAFLPWDHLEALTLQNFRSLFTRIPFPRWLFNSLFLASSRRCWSLLLAALADSRWPSIGLLVARFSCW